MGVVRSLAETAWRDYASEGVPASGAHNVAKSDVRTLFALLESLINVSAISATLTDQPVEPSIGDAYILPAGKTGAAWSGFTAGNIAVYLASGWLQIEPREGTLAYIQDEQVHKYRESGDWAAFTPTETGAGAIVVRAASSENLTLVGEQTVDGVAVAVGDSVLVKDQSDAALNGVYTVSEGSWTRAARMNAWIELPGVVVTVSEGSAHGDSAWQCAADVGGTLGTDDISFVQISSGQINSTRWGYLAQATAFGGPLLAAADLDALVSALGGAEDVREALDVYSTGEVDDAIASVEGGSGEAAVSAHIGQADPHGQYLLESAVSANGLTLVGATFAQMRGLLDVEVGVDVQAASANLTAYAGIAPSANVQSLLAAADAAAMRALLSVYSTVQADAQFLAKAGGTLTGPLTLPSDPSNALHAATKQYVDALPVRGSVRAATTANISLSGEQTVDGVELGVGDRVLVKNQTAAAENGIYITASGAWARAADMDAWSEVVSATVWVREGAVNAARAFISTAASTGTLNTTAISFELFGGSSAYQLASENLDTWAAVGPSSNGQSLVSAADYAAMRVLLDLEYGVDVYSKSAMDTLLGNKQAASANLTSFATAAPSANGLSLVSAANYAAMRALMDLEAGTDFVAYSAFHANALTLIGHTFAQMREDLDLEAGTDFYSISAANAQFVAKGGDTLTGFLTLHADPSNAMHPATKQYVDNIAAGLDVKPSVRAASTANLTLSGEQTIDGVSCTVGDRVLVKGQSDAEDNGIYVVASGAWARAADMDAWSEVPGASVWVEEGSANADKAFVCTANLGGTLGSTSITWAQFGGTGAYQAQSANLTTWSGIAPSADMQSFAAAANYAAMRALLDLEAGTDFLALTAFHANGVTLVGHTFPQMRTDLDLADLRYNVTRGSLGFDRTGAADDTSDWGALRTAYGGDTYKGVIELESGVYKSSTGFGNWNIYRSVIAAHGEVRLRNTGSGNALEVADAADYLTLAQIRGWPIVEGNKDSGIGLLLQGATHFYIEPNVRGAGTDHPAMRTEFGVAGLFMRPMVTHNHQHPSPQGFYDDGTGAATPLDAHQFDERNAFESCGHNTQLHPIYEGVRRWGWIEYAAIGTVTIGGTSEGNGRTVTLGEDPLTTASASQVVTVASADHRLETGDIVLISGASEVNGITVAGRYEITATGADAYTITHSAAASGDGAGGGAAVVEKSGGGWRQTADAYGSRVADLDWEVNAAVDGLIQGASAEVRGAHSDTWLWISSSAADAYIASGDYDTLYNAGADTTIGEGVRFNRFGTGGIVDEGARARINGALDVVANVRHYKNDAFYAHKNGTDQTGVTTATFVKVTLGTEAWDDWSTFDTSTSRWTPAINGKVRLSGQIWISGLTVNTSAYVQIQKNGGARATFIVTANGDGISAVPFSWQESVDGDDFLEIYAQGIEASSGSITIEGDVGLTFVQGEVV